jgi:toxin HigB-1
MRSCRVMTGLRGGALPSASAGGVSQPSRTASASSASARSGLRPGCGGTISATTRSRSVISTVSPPAARRTYSLSLFLRPLRPTERIENKVATRRYFVERSPAVSANETGTLRYKSLVNEALRRGPSEWVQAVAPSRPGLLRSCLRAARAAQPADFRREAINAAQRLDDLTKPPSNRLEKLRGNLKDFHSIRINDQWRLIFKWIGGEAYEVRIVDYH